MSLRQEPRRCSSTSPVPQPQQAGAAAQIHGDAAAVGHGLAHGLGQAEIAQNLAVEFVPVFGDAVKKLPRLERPLLDDAGGHVEIGPAGFIVLRKRDDAAQKIVPRTFRLGGVEDPQAVPPRMKQARFREYLEVSRYARLPHVEKRNQLVDGQLIVKKHQRKTQARFVGKGFEIPESFHNNVKCNKYQVLSM